jgi:Flp pilus assembly protein TadD
MARISGQYLGKRVTRQKYQELMALYEQKSFKKVILQIKKLFSKGITDPFLFRLSGLCSMQSGNLDFAEQMFRKSLALGPNHIDLSNLSYLLNETARYSESIKYAKKALLISPQFYDAKMNLGVAYFRSGAIDSAQEVFNSILAEGIKTVGIYKNIIPVLLATDDPGAAKLMIDEALQHHPNEKDFIFLQIEFYLLTNQPEKALDVLGRLDLREIPVTRVAKYRAKSYLLSSQPFEAIAELTSLPENERYGSTAQDLASAYLAIGKSSHSIELLTVKDDIDQQGLMTLGYAYRDLGNKALAEESFAKSWDKNPENCAPLYHLALTNPASEYLVELFDVETNLLQLRKGGLDEYYHQTNFLINDYRANYEQANLSLKQANQVRSKVSRYLKKDQLEFVEKCKIFTSSTRLDEQKRFQFEPLFIIGMPRSGTTLVDTILRAHSEVTSAGEQPFINRFFRKAINDKRKVSPTALHDFRAFYLDQLAHYSDERRLVVDKAPFNFYYLRVITELFPQSKIVHVTRSARATIWSNYRQLWAGQGFTYSYNLEDAQHFYGTYRDIVNYWREDCEINMLTVDYDKLVLNPEREIATLLDELGLLWEDSCLEPHRHAKGVRTASQIQVARPIYKDSGNHWRNYQEYLPDWFHDLES